MASLQHRDGLWQCQSMYLGKRRTLALGNVPAAEATAKSEQVDYLLMRLSQGLLTLPHGGDIVGFVRLDGVIPSVQDAPASRGEPTLVELLDRYLETHENGTLEHHTLLGIRRHFR
jgi:hypothetical protein